MTTFDAFTDQACFAFPPSVAHALSTVHTALGDVMLVGSWARDVCLVLGAGVEPGRGTDDLDVAVAVAVASLRELDRRLGELGPRRGHGVRIRVAGQPVDVLPFGDIAPEGVVRPASDDELDVTGMAEAWLHRDMVQVSPTHAIAVASRESMLLLKLIAWDVRTPGTEKDALDLDRLLDAASHGRYGDATFEHESSMARCEYEVERAGVYRCGLVLRERLRPATATRLAQVMTDARLIRLAALMPPLRANERLDQLELLREALALDGGSVGPDVPEPV